MPSLPPTSSTLSVDPEWLLVAAGQVEDETPALRQGFGIAEAAAAALPHWIGRSRDALAGATAGWSAATATLSGRLAALAAALRTCGVGFAEMDDAHAAALAPAKVSGRQ